MSNVMKYTGEIDNGVYGRTARSTWVRASDYDTLKQCYDGMLEAGNKALAERDLLRAALVEAKDAIKGGMAALDLAVARSPKGHDATLCSEYSAKLRVLADLAK